MFINNNYILIYLNKLTVNSTFIFVTLVVTILINLCIILSVAYFTLFERQLLASFQKRKGPEIVGIFGFLQPISDALKLLGKEIIVPIKSNTTLFILAPILTFILSLVKWSVIPFGNLSFFANIPHSILFISALTSFSVYGIIISGWASNSKYALLGSIRSIAQIISYELPLSVVVLCVSLMAGSFSLLRIIDIQENFWFFQPLMPLGVMFLILMLAETNRPPFDLPECESELTAGYFVEYSGFLFALFFLAEYSNMILMGYLFIIFFFGGFSFFYLFDIVDSIFITFIKNILIIYFFIWIRATFPRYRFDQLMILCWKILLPISLAWLVIISSFFYICNGFPISYGD